MNINFTFHIHKQCFENSKEMGEETGPYELKDGANLNKNKKPLIVELADDNDECNETSKHRLDESIASNKNESLSSSSVIDVSNVELIQTKSERYDTEDNDEQQNHKSVEEKSQDAFENFNKLNTEFDSLD
jgi:hypothetical protein